MKILSLDMATKTGWALAENGKLIESGVQAFSLDRGESPGMRFYRFRSWLENLIATFRPQLVVYEQTHLRGGAATEIAVGFATRAQEIAALYLAEHVAVHSATIKKHATGKGRCEKSDMIVSSRVRWGVDPQDDNEADALCLLAFAIEKYDTNSKAKETNCNGSNSRDTTMSRSPGPGNAE